MTRIYLFRHAEAEGNIKREFHGQTEGLITPRGRLQLDALAHRCGELPIERIYSSPLIRAVETAKAVNRLKGVDHCPEKFSYGNTRRRVGAYEISGLPHPVSCRK